MNWLSDILSKVGSVVDAAIPVVKGDRTKISALIAVASPVICTALTPVFPAACPVIAGLGQLATTLLPLFAFAGMVRK